MREVSCRVVEVWERVAHERGLPFDDLVGDLPLSLAELRDPAGWMDWDVLIEIVDRFERAIGSDGFVRIGHGAVRQEVLQPIRRVAGLALSLRHLYRFAMRWQLPLLHRNLLVKVAGVGKHQVRIELRIPDYFRGSCAWFRVIQGGLEAMPLMQNLPHARVEAEISSHHAVYLVTLPQQPVRLFSRLTAWLRDPALLELERQVRELRTIDRERAHLEGALRERERMLANLIANLSGMVYRCSGDDFEFDFVSERSLELTGYGHGELTGSGISYFALVHPDDVQGLREKRRACIEAHLPCSDEYRLRTRQGELRRVLDVARGVYDAEGRVSGVEGFVTDITARKRLEEDLAQAQRVEGLGRLAGGIAHDFNNLLTVILGSAELAELDLPRTSGARMHLDHVRLAAERAAALTQQLLAFARKQVIESRIVSLNSLVLGMNALLSRALNQDVELDCLLASELWTVEVDPGQFEQVLLNLAINARDAMLHGGTLTIETANIALETPLDALPGLPPGHYVMLSVSDTGAGMTDEVQRRAFEPFFTTKGVGKGTGLGLSSAHGIVRQALGEIFLESEVGRGTCFRIYLPRVDGAEEPKPEIERLKPTRGGRETVLPVEDHEPDRDGQDTVLLVEDHELVREMAVHTLEAHGYVVLAAASGLEALELVADLGSWPALLLVDIVMPQMSGTALAARLLELRPTLPVLYMSGHSELPLLRDPSGHSVAGFLQKPFTSTSLVHKVRVVLDWARALAATSAGVPVAEIANESVQSLDTGAAS